MRGILGKVLIRAVGNTAKAGVQAVGSQTPAPAPGGGKKSRKRVRKSECTPCAAFADVDRAFKQARNGSL